MGYRPDPVLSSIAASRWRGNGKNKRLTFAFISQFRKPHAGVDWINLSGAEARAAEFGCRIDKFTLEEYSNSSALQRVLVTRGLKGLIVAPFFDSNPQLTLDWNKFCAVSIGITPFQPLLHAVTHDVFDAILIAWRRAVAYGYQRPGLVIPLHSLPSHVDDDENRQAAALILQQQCRPHNRIPPLIYSLQAPYATTVKKVLHWYQRWKPDAIIGFNGAMKDILMKEGNLRIPGQVGFAQLTTLPDMLDTAGIREPAEDIGKASVDLLLLTLRTNQWGLPLNRIRHYLEPRWNDGSSLPRLTNTYT